MRNRRASIFLLLHLVSENYFTRVGTLPKVVDRLLRPRAEIYLTKIGAPKRRGNPKASALVIFRCLIRVCHLTTCFRR